MKLKHTLILTALAVALNGAFVANAADEKPVKEEKAEKAQPADKAQPSANAGRHGHAEQNKQGATGKTDDMCCRNPAQAATMPMHDHGGRNK